MKKIGDEYFCFLSECEDPKACTIVLRGASRDILKEVTLRIKILGLFWAKLLSLIFEKK